MPGESPIVTGPKSTGRTRDKFSTGSPGGGALSNPDWYLNAGDVIESEIEGIGILTNGVVDEEN